MLWALIAVMTAAAVMAVLWPLSRRARHLHTGNDVAVYKDQLEEIGRDQNWGLIAPTEAEAARVEVSRRLIAAAAADAKAEQPSRDASLRGRRLVAVIALAILPICAITIYLAVGSPDLPGQPLASRAATPGGGGAFGRRVIRPGGAASRAESRRRTRLGSGRADLHAARPLRRCGQGAGERASAARRHRGARGGSGRGAGFACERRGDRRREGGFRPRAETRPKGRDGAFLQRSCGRAGQSGGRCRAYLA